MENGEAKSQFIMWVLLFQEFYLDIKDRQQCENQVVYQLSRSKFGAAMGRKLVLKMLP